MIQADYHRIHWIVENVLLLERLGEPASCNHRRMHDIGVLLIARHTDYVDTRGSYCPLLFADSFQTKLDFHKSHPLVVLGC